MARKNNPELVKLEQQKADLNTRIDAKLKEMAKKPSDNLSQMVSEVNAMHIKIIAIDDRIERVLDPKYSKICHEGISIKPINYTNRYNR